MQVKKQQLDWTRNNRLVSNAKRSTSKLYIVTLIIKRICRIHHVKLCWMKHKIATGNINHLRYADDTTLMAESEEELKSLLMKVKEESEKVGLKISIRKTKIMASGPITSWQIDGERVETGRLFSLAPKSLQMVTEAMKLKDACSLEEKL